MLKRILSLCLALSLVFAFSAYAQKANVDNAEISGIVKESGLIIGLGYYIRFEQDPSKTFLLSKEQSVGIGALKEEKGVPSWSNMKGRKLKVIYENKIQQKFGRPYYNVANLQAIK